MSAELIFENAYQIETVLNTGDTELTVDLEPNIEIVATFTPPIPNAAPGLSWDITTNPGFVTIFDAGVAAGKIRLLS